jgi:hypothetical protein
VDDEAPVDDIAAERDADAAHHVFMRELEESAPPSLLDASDDDDERLADLAIEEPASVANESPWDYKEGAETELARPAALPTPRHAQSRNSRPLIEHGVLRGTVEGPRTAMLPLALALILGLLLGFAAGYAAGGRGNASAAATMSAPPAPTAPAASGATQPSAAGREWSEQAVRQSPPVQPRVSGDVPPVPGDGPAPLAAPAAAARAALPRATNGRLVIRSTPSGAGVTVNGKWRGRTPLTIEPLQFGPYSVRLVQPGYAVVRESVILSASDPARTLSIGLQRERGASTAASRGQMPAQPPSGRASGRAAAGPDLRRPSVSPSAFAGTIYVDSLPRGARVLIDGRQMGTTPASIPDIPIGSHVVRLELADHRAWTAATRVAAGQETRVTGSLERIR